MSNSASTAAQQAEGTDSGTLGALTSDLGSAAQPIYDKLHGWGEGLLAMTPNLVVALMVVVAAVFLGRLASGGATRVAQRTTDNQQAVRLASAAARLAVMLAGLFLALSVLQLEKTVTSILAGAGVLGIAIGFAVQGLAASLVAGLVLSWRRPYSLGNLVELAGHIGRVENVDFRTTRLRALTGELLILPNKDIVESTITNLSEARSRRVDVAVGVTYDADLEQAQKVALDAVRRIEGLAGDPRPEVFFTGFGASSIDLVCRVRISPCGQADVMKARSEVVKAVKRAFDAHDISIPFPIRTLELAENARTIEAVLREAG